MRFKTHDLGLCVAPGVAAYAFLYIFGVIYYLVNNLEYAPPSLTTLFPNQAGNSKYTISILGVDEKAPNMPRPPIYYTATTATTQA